MAKSFHRQDSSAPPCLTGPLDAEAEDHNNAERSVLILKAWCNPGPPAGSKTVVSPWQQEMGPVPLTPVGCKLHGDFIYDNFKIFQYIHSSNKCLNSQA